MACPTYLKLANPNKLENLLAVDRSVNKNGKQRNSYGISIETKELCCRDLNDCLLYRIYLYVLDNTAILSECSPFRERGGGGL